MELDAVHYEVFLRKNPTSRWVLELATDQPHVALATAEELVTSGRVAAAMVTKETFDEGARVFHSEILFKEVVADAKRKASLQEWDPLCNSPPDLYTERARERIAGLIEGWLARKTVTVFELLHSAELVEQLEATSTELQHAVQKFAVAEIQIRGGITHDLIRRIQRLLDSATDRLQSDHRRGAFPQFGPSDFAAAANKLASHPDGGYLLGGAVAQAIAPAGNWRNKVQRLLDLLDAAPPEGPGRKLALSVLDQPLAEILLSKDALGGLVGDCEDLGAVLAALARLVSREAVERAGQLDPATLEVMPSLSSEGDRLADRLSEGELVGVRAAVARRILSDLHGHKRLRPADPMGEIAVLRALVLTLTAAAGSLLPEEDVAAALAARSRTLLSTDFLETYLGDGRPAREEAQRLVWLAQSIVGAANKRRVARLLQGAIFSLKFETEILAAGEPPPARLAALAALQRSVSRCGLVAQDCKTIQDKLGLLGDRIEERSGLIAALMKSKATAIQKLSFLLRLASGETGPLGPAADRARAEALRLVKDDGLRAELSRDEDQMSAVRDLIREAGLAA